MLLGSVCEQFHDMQIVRHAKYVGTMIGLDGYLDRWTALKKYCATRDEKFILLPKGRLSDCVI